MVRRLRDPDEPPPGAAPPPADTVPIARVVALPVFEHWRVRFTYTQLDIWYGVHCLVASDLPWQVLLGTKLLRIVRRSRVKIGDFHIHAVVRERFRGGDERAVLLDKSGAALLFVQTILNHPSPEGTVTTRTDGHDRLQSAYRVEELEAA